MDCCMTRPLSVRHSLFVQPQARRRHQVLRFLPLGLLLSAIGCAGGLNCGSGCASDYVYGTTAVSVPNGVRAVDDGVRMRISQTGLDFLQTHLREILASQLGEANGEFRIQLPPAQLSGATVEYGRASVEPFENYPTTVIINAEALGNNLTFQFDDVGNGLTIRAQDIPIGVDMRLFSDFGIGNAACHLTGTSPQYGGSPYITGLSIEARVQPRVGRGAECDDSPPDSECLKLDVNIISIDLDPRGDLGAEDLDISQPPSCSPECGSVFGGPACDATYGNHPETFCSEQCSDTTGFESADLECQVVCTVSNFFVDVAVEFIGLIEPLIQGFLDEVLEGAIRTALDGVDGAPLAASGLQNVAAVAPGILPESALDLGFSISPTGDAFDVNVPAGGILGMDMILKTGFEASAALDPNQLDEVPHPCVRPIEGVEFADLFGDGVRGEFEVPDNLVEPLSGTFQGQPYHIGASLAKPVLNQAMFALYNSGGFCVEVNSETINTLTGGDFQLSAATLDLLTGGKLKQFADPNAPAIVAIAPSQPPVITYGAGTAEEGHIIVNWPNVEVSFYVLMFERFARVFAVSADIALQISVFNEPDNETINISIVDGPNVENFVENYNELLPGVNFTEVLESLVSVAFDAALGDGLEFDFDVGGALSDAVGVPIFMDFQGIETTPVPNREFLNLYLSMTDTQPQPRIISPLRLQLPADPGVLRISQGEAVAQPLRASIPTGQVFVEVDADQSAGDAAFEREYFARIDFGAWRGPLRAQAGRIVVKDAKLNLAGQHTITVRSRVLGEPNTLEAQGTSVSLWIDPSPPVVSVQRQDSFITAQGRDDATDAVDLVYAWQLDDAAPGEFAPLDRLDIETISASRVSVRVRDRAGNVSNSAAIDIVTEKVRLKNQLERESETSRGCSSSGSGSSGVVGALGMLLLWRRRQRR